MSTYRYRSLASQLCVVADGVASQQSRHFRTTLGGSNTLILRAACAAAQVVLGESTTLVAKPLDGLPAMLREYILDEPRSRGRLDVQLELEVAKLFALRTDRMADRCLKLARLSLKVSPGERALRFLSRVGRSYVAGLQPETVVMCRAVLEQAVLERFGREKKALPRPDGKSEMGARLSRAEDLGWITRGQRQEIWQVHLRGNKAVHENPDLTADALDTIEITMRMLGVLYSDVPAA